MKTNPTSSFLFVLCFLIVSMTLKSQSELLDNSFGTDGLQTDIFPKGDDRAQKIIALSDGKILAGGVSFFNGKYQISLTRYHPDGSLDGSFGTDGISITNLQNSFFYSFFPIHAMEIQADGRIALVSERHLVYFHPDGTFDEAFETQGYSSGAVFQPDGKVVAFQNIAGIYSLVRFHPDGSSDLTFQNVPISVLGNNPYPNVMAIQPDSTIVIAGSVDTTLWVAKINTNGIYDNSFGVDGILILDPGNGYDRPYDIIAQANGKILISGVASYPEFLMLRLLEDGTLDDSFGINGILTSDLSRFIDEIALSSDNDIIAIGWQLNNRVVMRFQEDGTFDDNFGNNGILQIEMSDPTLAIQDDQQIIALGNKDSDFALTRISPEGSFDLSFNEGNYVTTDIGNNYGEIYDLALDQDGNIHVIGSLSGRLAVAKYEVFGHLDTSYNNNYSFFSTALTPWYTEYGRVIHFQEDGKIIAGGTDEEVGDHVYTSGILLRLNPDGTRDSSFSNTSYLRDISDLDLQPDGKVLTVGVTYSYMPFKWSYLVRYQTDGSLDTIFGNNGIVSSEDEDWYSVALLPDDNILVAGKLNQNILLRRFLSNGTPDSTFAADGLQLINIGNWFKFGDLLIQPDGKILISSSSSSNFYLHRFLETGELQNFGITALDDIELHSIALKPDGKILAGGEKNNDFCLVQFLPNGDVDTTISGDGFVTTDFDGGIDRANNLIIQPDGKILLAGTSDGQFALARYLPDLTVDVMEVFTSGFLKVGLAPNPATDYIDINSPKFIKPTEVSIFDIQGKLMSQQPISPGQPIDLKFLVSGMYYLKFEVNGSVYTGKFVKQ